MVRAQSRTLIIIVSDPIKNFEFLWKTFHDRYPFFDLRKVDWQQQFEIYRAKVTNKTNDDELFEIFCEMLSPLNDGHVELIAKTSGKHFRPEKKPRFHQEFGKQEIEQLFKTTGKTLADNGFELPKETEAWMLHYSRSSEFGYIRILELEGVKKERLTGALDTIAHDFNELKGIIIDIRDNPGGDDSTAIAIINRFCDHKRVAFHRKTKVGPGKEDLTPLKTFYLEPQGDVQFTGPIALLTCDSVFSGGEAFALAIKQLPYVTVIGDRTNGIFSYQLEKKLPNGWNLCLSYQIYFSADMVCYEGKGVPVDIELRNSMVDIENGIDPLIARALEVLRSKNPEK